MSVRARKFAIAFVFFSTMVDGLLTLNEQYFYISMEFHSVYIFDLVIFFFIFYAVLPCCKTIVFTHHIHTRTGTLMYV